LQGQGSIRSVQIHGVRVEVDLNEMEEGINKCDCKNSDEFFDAENKKHTYL